MEMKSLHQQIPINWLQCCLVQTPHDNNLNFIGKKTILDRKLKMCLLDSVICALYDYLNPIFLGAVLPGLLFNQFLHVKERALERQCAATQSCPIGDNAYAIN